MINCSLSLGTTAAMTSLRSLRDPVVVLCLHIARADTAMQDSDVQTVAVVLLPPIFTIFGRISAGLSCNTSARTQVTLFHARGVYGCFCSVVFKGLLSFCCFLLPPPKLKKWAWLTSPS